MLKNIEFSRALALDAQVEYQKGQIVSKTFVQNGAVSLTLFAFDKGEEIASHSSNGDAMVTVQDGSAEITVGDGRHTLTRGETIVMPAGVPHALFAPERFKMLLTVVFPEQKNG